MMLDLRPSGVKGLIIVSKLKTKSCKGNSLLPNCSVLKKCFNAVSANSHEASIGSFDILPH